MCWHSRVAICALAILAQPVFAESAGYLLGGGVESDTEDSLALSAFAQYGWSEDTWLSLAAGTTTSEGSLDDLRTRYGSAGMDHWFKPVGVRLDIGYWGNSDVLDSIDLGGSVYWKNDGFSISANYEHRNIDLILEFGEIIERREVGVTGDGFGLALRKDIGDRTNVYLRGMNYSYSRNPALLRTLLRFDFIVFSSLSLANSLVDDRISGGISVDFGLRSLDLDLTSEKSALDSLRVNSISTGLVFPVATRSDLELRLGYSDTEDQGGATLLSAFWYFYGK